MALNNAWWLAIEPEHSIPASSSSQDEAASHLAWPWNLPKDGVSLRFAEQRLRRSPGTACNVQKLYYDRSKSPPRWVFSKSIHTAEDLVQAIQERLPEEADSVVYIVEQMESEAIQAFGYHLTISTRYFNMPHSGRTIGQPVERHLYFTLHYLDHYKDGISPAETSKDHVSARYRFQATPGIYHAERWDLTSVKFILVRLREGRSFATLVEIDPIDHAFAKALQFLMIREDEQPFGGAENYAGLGRLLAHTFYMITFIWTSFLREAQKHLHILVRRMNNMLVNATNLAQSDRCVDLRLSQKEQLSLRRELHKLSNLWRQVGRLMTSNKHVIDQICEHPFFRSICGCDGRKDLTLLLAPQHRMLIDHIAWCNDLAEQTKSLSNLTWNISQLQDTKAAVEETKVANVLASSIRRVTMLTFVYLPLTLAAVSYYSLASQDYWEISFRLGNFSGRDSRLHSLTRSEKRSTTFSGSVGSKVDDVLSFYDARATSHT